MKKGTSLVLASALLASGINAQASNEKRYYVNAADIGATTLPAYLTTGTDPWDKATLTTINWATWQNSWAASTLSTALTTPTPVTSDPFTTGLTSPTSSPTDSSTTSSTDTSSTSTSTSDNEHKTSDSDDPYDDDHQRSAAEEKRDSRRAKIVIGVVCGIVGLILLLSAIVMLLCFLQKRKHNIDDEKNVTIIDVSGDPSGGAKFGLAAAAAAGGGLAGAGAVEVLDGQNDRIHSPVADNASTITGSFESLSEKLKEIQQQYSNDGDDMSTFSTIDGKDEGLAAAGAGAFAATGARSNRSSVASSSSSESDRSSISSYRSSLHEVSPSVNNRSLRTMSPTQTGPAENSLSASRESDDDLYVDRKLETSEEESRSINNNNLAPEDIPRKSTESPNTVTTGTSILSRVDSDAASFEQDSNYPNKYNNFATELIASKSKKAGAASPSALTPVTEVGEKGEISSGSPSSTGSKKRVSQFDFEPEEEGEEKQRKPSDGSFFTETV